MIYIVRIKAVSECMRIRRAALCYVRFENFTYDIHKEPHPLKKFISFKIEDSSIIIDGKKESLKVNEEVFFYKNNMVDTGSSMENEELVLGAMLIPLDKSMENQFLELIKENQTLDQWNGELEYLLGMLYEFEFHDDKKAEEYYLLAREKKFNFYLLNKDKVC